MCIRAVFLLLCVYFFASGVMATESNIAGLRKGQPISKLRKLLGKHGWQPRVTYLKFGDEGYEHNFSTAGILYKAGFHEVETCTGTGANPCIFNYLHKSGKCLRVFTTGEYSVGQYEPEVDDWSFACPPPGALKEPGK